MFGLMELGAIAGGIGGISGALSGRKAKKKGRSAARANRRLMQEQHRLGMLDLDQANAEGGIQGEMAGRRRALAELLHKLRMKAGGGAGMGSAAQDNREMFGGLLSNLGAGLSSMAGGAEAPEQDMGAGAAMSGLGAFMPGNKYRKLRV